MKIILTLQSPLKDLRDLPIMLWELWSKITSKAPFSHEGIIYWSSLNPDLIVNLPPLVLTFYVQSDFIITKSNDIRN